MSAERAETLDRRTVHVWLFSLDEVTEDDAADLDDAERARAAALAFGEDRRRFLAGRACLRGVCRRYVADLDEPFKLEYGEGRPSVPGARLACSLSHTGDLIAVAVARHEVGIDVEHLRGIEPEPALVARACSTTQRRQLEQIAPGNRERAFLVQWVRKEALGKALGVGLDLALTPAPLRAFPRAGGRRHRGFWRVFELETPDGYVGAVAARGAQARVVTRRRSP